MDQYGGKKSPTPGQMKSSKTKVFLHQNHSTPTGKRVATVRTPGGLTAKDLKVNKRGKIVSIKASNAAKKRFAKSGLKRLTKAEFLKNVRSKLGKSKKSPTKKSDNTKLRRSARLSSIKKPIKK